MIERRKGCPCIYFGNFTRDSLCVSPPRRNLLREAAKKPASVDSLPRRFGEKCFHLVSPRGEFEVDRRLTLFPGFHLRSRFA